MKTQTQLEWVKKQLKEHGKVSRNHALSVYISRLGARILDLKNAGWEIDTEQVRTPNGGRDYVYSLRNRPKVRKIVVIDGRAVETFV